MGPPTWTRPSSVTSMINWTCIDTSLDIAINVQHVVSLVRERQARPARTDDLVFHAVLEHARGERPHGGGDQPADGTLSAHGIPVRSDPVVAQLSWQIGNIGHHAREPGPVRE